MPSPIRPGRLPRRAARRSGREIPVPTLDELDFPGAPSWSVAWLRRIPAEFRDDGCSGFADRVAGRDLSWACRLHDALYCSRLWGPLTPARKLFADHVLRAGVAHALAGTGLFRRALARAVWSAVRVFGVRYFDTCGPGAGERCRHGLPLREDP